MAEIQKTTSEAGETTQRFIEFVMMHAQQAAFAMGQIPHPETGQAEVNLDVARIFIDQLAMIRAKTRGNLSDDEQKVLNNAISQLQMVFVEISAQAGEIGAAPGGEMEPEAVAPTAEPAVESASPVADGDEGESKKKFTKSYGA